MTKACIFDLDGTLLNTATTIGYFINKTLALFGIPPITEDEVKIFVGNGARTLVERTLASKGIDDPELLEKVLKTYNEDYDSHSDYLTEPYDGIPEALAALKAKGLRLGVISNKPDPTAKSAVERFFPGVFDATFGGVDGVPLKPDPTRTAALCREIGVSPGEVCYFGDTAVDMKNGLALGARLTVGLLWGFRSEEELKKGGAQVLIAHPSEILNLVED